MNVQNIKKGFYTDGENVFSKEFGMIAQWLPCREESEWFLKKGNECAKFTEDLEVKPVKAGMIFCNGEIVVLNKNMIEITEVVPINPLYNEKGYCIKKDGYRTFKRKYRA